MTADGVERGSGLLDGLEGAARRERAELIAWLLERGFDVEQIRNTPVPTLLPARRLLGDDGTYVSTREISEANGIDLEFLQRMLRAIGLPRVDDPDAPVLLRADGEAAARARRFVDAGLEPDQLVAVLLVVADGLTRAVEVMRSAGLAAIIHPGATELEIAQGSEALMSRVAPLLGPTMQDILYLQLRHSLETAAVSPSELAAGSATAGAREVSVAFGDLVGFTRLGEAVPPEDLERLASRLTNLARDTAVTPVRFIKTIGDAVMLVSPEPALLLEAALDLAHGADDHDLPQLRVGVASGWAVSRAGDWFGSPVNVASRVTNVARPGTVLVAESTRGAVGDDERFAWSFAGARRLKGVSGETKLFRVRRSVKD